MKYTSALISDARNKLGGDVFARNRAGLYVRVKVKPKNPKTTNQQANRANFSTYTKAWRSLTAAQITGWNTLAGSSSLTDTLGNSYQPSGLQLFISCNRNLALIGATAIANPPVVKPAFPIIFGAGAVAQVHAGAWVNVYFFVTASAYAVFTHVQGSVTKGLSPGVTFVGRSLYRNIGRGLDGGTNTIYWTPTGLLNAPVPAPGKGVGCMARIVDPLTGYASMPETVLITAVEV
jgi:hypothetical protein